MRGFTFLFRSIRGKILVSFFICTMIPITTILYSFYQSSGEVVKEEIQRSNQEALHQIAIHMNDLAERMLKASNLIMNDPDFNQFLDAGTDWNTNYQDLRRYNIVQQRLSNVRDILLDSGAVIAVIDGRGFVHTTLSEPNDQGKQAQLLKQLEAESWLEETKVQHGWPVWKYPYEGAIQKLAGGNESYFTLSRCIQGNPNEAANVLFIGIPSSVFLPIKKQPWHTEHSSFMLLNEQNQLVGGETPLTLEETDDLIKQVILKQRVGAAESEISIRDYAISVEQFPRLGWKLVQFTPQTELWNQLGGIRNQSVLWLFGWFLLFTVVFIYFMIRLTKPLKQLVSSMNRLGSGDFHSYVTIEGKDEFTILGNHFNHMLDRLQQLIMNLSEEQKRKEEAKLQTLQAQINPHFLFNTLNSIKWMAMLSGAKHVSQMITKLGKLLQYTMKVGEEFVTLEDEITHLESYLDLQKIRFNDNILIQFDIPTELKHYSVLKFILQPIVENSIIHGQKMPLNIEICASLEGDSLLIKVKDNGHGISEERLEELRTQLSQDHARYSGIGIYNVNERIKMHFSRAYGIEMKSLHGEGTVVTVKLPLQSVQAANSVQGRVDKETSRND
ncbi:HAMP domain-containing protein [Paenibacillus sp. 5J-6]|uniref:histidine kinase n=2 Tax=Paenibacillus silvestris TaxID=2606219 RepID=A0A6L8V1C1_9BACL|nr:HAMP domain-containing protein [Paenibacillus silvestris]